MSFKEGMVLECIQGHGLMGISSGKKYIVCNTDTDRVCIKNDSGHSEWIRLSDIGTYFKIA